MTTAKSSNKPNRAAAPGNLQRAANAPKPQPGNAPTGAKRPSTVDEAIAKAQNGRVTVSPTKAIEMAGKLYSSGRYDQAIRVCQQIIAARPDNADAHNILGVSLNAQDQAKEGIKELRRAIELAPGAASYHANLGEVLRQSGKLDEAAEALEQAVKLDPSNAQALNNLGIVAYERKQFAKAADFYRSAIAIRPEMAEAHNNLGNALRMAGKFEDAIQAYQDALVIRERYPEAYNNLGTLLRDQRRFEEGEHALKKAIQQSPRYVEAHNNLAGLYVAQERDVDALRYLGDALKIQPRNPQTLLLTARIQVRRNNVQAAEQAMRTVVQDDPDNAEALTVLGQVLHETDRYEEAIEVLEKALVAQPENMEARNFYGVALKSVGRLDEAREHLVTALNKNKNLFGAYANLNDLIDFSEGEGAKLFEHMDEIFAKAKNHEAPLLLPLHFAYAKALDDRGEHERALRHYITGGKMKRAQLKYDEAETHGFFDKIRAVFPKEAFENRKFAGLQDDRPVFIVGMPRSGSTLVEQIISSHPDLYGAGEVKYLSYSLGQLRDRFPSLPKYPDMMTKITPPQMEIVAKNYLRQLTASSGDAKRVTDKLLTNYFFIGLINQLFPNAKIIHTQRDPVDTCLSGFTKLFKDDTPHSYDLTELGRYYGKYRELMAHWDTVLPEGVLMTVQYEDVVADTEKEAKRLIEFLALPWDDKCVDFHKSDRPVKTASVAQVRKPIYKTSVKRWKKYGSGLQPLVDAIEGKPEKAGAKAKAKAKPKVKENA
ncbi:MAG: tetratricopeptide repeat protein [Sphingomicrobium sp.]